MVLDHNRTGKNGKDIQIFTLSENTHSEEKEFNVRNAEKSMQ